jgi:GDPmannose 4,6-dehydratase
VIETIRALITGVTGQDGSCMAGQLLDKGYEFHGVVRGSRIDHVHHDDHFPERTQIPHVGDGTRSARMHQMVADITPHEVYNLAA